MRWVLFCAVTAALVTSASAQDSYIPVLIKPAQPSYSGMLKPFDYVKQKPGQAPSTKSPGKAAAKPPAAKSLPAYHFAPAAHDGAQPAGIPLDAKTLKPVFRPAPASIKLSPDIVKVPAETASGYCLHAPASYIGTGSSSRPPVTPALPRCENLASPSGN
jgi:hypothetical protein